MRYKLWITIAFLALVASGCEFLGQGGNGSQSQPPSSAPEISAISTLNVAGSDENIAVDSNGNIFYLDVDAGNVIKVEPNGAQRVFASYGATGGYGTIAIDKSNNLYVAANSTIVKISPNGNVSSFGCPTGLMPALQMTVDNNGNIFYTDATEEYVSANIIKKVTPTCAISVFAGTGAAGNANGNGTSASFNNPQSLVADSSNNIYVVDAGNFLIRKISPSGDVTTFAGNGVQAVHDGAGTSASFYLRSNPGAYITIDSSDNLYVGDNEISTGYIRRISPSGAVTTICGNGSTTVIDAPGSCDASAVYADMGLAVGPNGTIFYVAGTGLFAISK